VTDESMESLNAFNKLEILNLRKTAISKDGLFRLKALGHLKELDLRGCQRLKDSDLDLLQPFTNLVVLKLSDTDIKNINLLSKGPTIDLQHLFLDSTKFDDSSIRDCKPMPQLKSISLERTAVTTQGLIRLASVAPALRSLDIEKCKNLNNSDLSFISKFKKLNRLVLLGWKGNEAGMQNILASHLAKIEFKECGIENKDLLTLSKLQSLKDLDLRRNRLLSAPAISDFQKLRPDVKVPQEPIDSILNKQLLQVKPPGD
jgi:hypothetical protein